MFLGHNIQRLISTIYTEGSPKLLKFIIKMKFPLSLYRESPALRTRLHAKIMFLSLMLPALTSCLSLT